MMTLTLDQLVSFQVRYTGGDFTVCLMSEIDPEMSRCSGVDGIRIQKGFGIRNLNIYTNDQGDFVVEEHDDCDVYISEFETLEQVHDHIKNDWMNRG